MRTSLDAIPPNRCKRPIPYTQTHRIGLEPRNRADRRVDAPPNSQDSPVQQDDCARSSHASTHHSGDRLTHQGDCADDHLAKRRLGDRFVDFVEVKDTVHNITVDLRQANRVAYRHRKLLFRGRYREEVFTTATLTHQSVLELPNGKQMLLMHGYI